MYLNILSICVARFHGYIYKPEIYHWTFENYPEFHYKSKYQKYVLVIPIFTKLHKFACFNFNSTYDSLGYVLISHVHHNSQET